MRKNKKKHHIYAIVVSKRKKGLFFIIILAIATGIIGAQFADNAPEGTYSALIKTSCEDMLHPTQNERTKASPMLYTGSLLSLCSPLFTEKGEALPVFNPKGADTADNTGDQYAEPKPLPSSKNAEEKNIASQSLKIINATSYKINAAELADANFTYDATGEEPKVLIVHTHGCETYSDQSGKGLGKSGTYRTTDAEKNVVKIGEMLTSRLKDAGIAAIHDKTLCDYPSYNKSYINSMEVIERYKKEYPSISFVFDIHRDAIANADGTPIKLTYQGKDEKCAQAMIVCGTDAMGLSHPYWKDNLILALKIQKVLEDKYPGFMRPVNLRQERFNMHETKGSLIFEIGTHGNTLDEAKRSIDYLADGIIEVIGAKY